MRSIFFIIITSFGVNYFVHSQPIASNIYSITKQFSNDQTSAYLYLGNISNTGYGTYGKLTATAHFCGQLFIAEFELYGTYYAGSTTDWIQVPLARGNDWNGQQNLALDVRMTTNGAPFEIRLRRLSGGNCGSGGGGAVYLRIETNGVYTETISEGIATAIPTGYLGKTAGWQFPVMEDRFTRSENGLFIKNNGNIGIGTTNPETILNIAGGGAAKGVKIQTVSNHATYFETSTNNNTIITRVQSNSDGGFVGTLTNQPFGIVSNGVFVINATTTGNVGIGTTNPGSYKLAVEGTIGARKLKVTQTTWADEVFKPAYKLKSLQEVEQFILKHKHLPDFPSEKQVVGKDIDVGDTQALLLKKIEELTLYLIEVKKDSEQFKNDITTVTKENKQLKEKLKKIEKKIK